MKKVLLDTSVLVAATLSEHEHHEVALPWLSGAHRDDFELLVAGHSIAEMFSVLTRYPLRPRLSPTGAARIIRESVKSKARIVALTSTEYLSTVQQVADLELRGGIVYDALIARAGLTACAAWDQRWDEYEALAARVAEESRELEGVDDDFALCLQRAADACEHHRDRPRAKLAYGLALEQWRALGRTEVATRVLFHRAKAALLARIEHLRNHDPEAPDG